MLHLNTLRDAGEVAYPDSNTQINTCGLFGVLSLFVCVQNFERIPYNSLKNISIYYYHWNDNNDKNLSGKVNKQAYVQ